MKSFRTLRGFLDGGEPDEDTYFAFSASLRICGPKLDLDEITTTLRLTPTHTHRRGERRSRRSSQYQHDHWSYEAPIHESRPLDEHVLALWESVRPAVPYLRSLKAVATVDVFLGYRSNCDHAGFEIAPAALEMFIALDIPFGMSIIVT